MVITSFMENDSSCQEDNGKEESSNPSLVKKQSKQNKLDKVDNHGKPSKPSIDHNNEQRALYQMGLLTTLGMCIHNFPEGIAIYVACLNGVNSGLTLTAAMALHSLPEGVSIAAPIYAATGRDALLLSSDTY